ncbi:hypothetical protein LX32DRAFT_352534 [Colletotrichum zoysiae]|uniref:Uncharacterized protein n=1 Tax=Colletotrichum zoysiae TaxID=1216348 RepID=A0AAD9HIM5_9PEZI|nr:hypothetical protein LX32DRAFT_352534 [Colletotrichum zoysiae]
MAIRSTPTWSRSDSECTVMCPSAPLPRGFPPPGIGLLGRSGRAARESRAGEGRLSCDMQNRTSRDGPLDGHDAQLSVICHWRAIEAHQISYPKRAPGQSAPLPSTVRIPAGQQTLVNGKTWPPQPRGSSPPSHPAASHSHIAMFACLERYVVYNTGWIHRYCVCRAFETFPACVRLQPSPS